MQESILQSRTCPLRTPQPRGAAGHADVMELGSCGLSWLGRVGGRKIRSEFSIATHRACKLAEHDKEFSDEARDDTTHLAETLAHQCMLQLLGGISFRRARLAVSTPTTARPWETEPVIAVAEATTCEA